MATRPAQEDAIETFVRITGASRSLAAQRLEEYGGNVEAAVNAHFGQLEGHVTNPMQVSHQTLDSPRGGGGGGGGGGVLPFLSAARSFRPSLLLDPHYRRSLYEQIGASVLPARQPPYPDPARYHSGYEPPYHPPGWSPFDENPGGTSSPHGPGIHGNLTEEEMVRMAIEASSREDLPGAETSHRQHYQEDEELARAISLSMKTAEQEEAKREQTMEDHKRSEVHDSRGSVEKKLNPGSSSLQERGEHVQEHLLLDDLSSKELDEAIILEKAYFGEFPGRTSIQSSPRCHDASDQTMGLNSKHIPCSPSPSVAAQKSLREQQDDEYLASLVADREKEVQACKKAESSCLKEGECGNKMLKEEDFDRVLAAKEASLPLEPGVDDENAVSLLVRMPDGSRRGRRFLKSDKLQFLFDFIDVGKAVKPGTYRVVRPYPRRAFCTSDASLSLSELGLTNRQEALFLELI
ncbi:hypothetical protein Tsubulata_048503 [Turnera subulata]|uniref:UBX domain-containing protein n=1 Tax=Turnera subulata TaxID=218843 RepID=A0A9Q0J1B4_9ROSI|nr:hypothetical protein Tsubulata_048503 [Turnera subulata]